MSASSLPAPLAFPLRALVVDDEPLARQGLALRLGWLPDITVVGAYPTAREAVDALDGHSVDVVFLDIEMPEADGFALLEQLDRDLLPAVVFVTAHDEYAVRAFRVGAFDYLLKPFDDQTLRATVERVRTFVSLVRGSDRQASSAPAEAVEGRDESPVPPAGRLVIRENGRVVFVDPGDIDWVEAAGDYVHIHTRSVAHTLRATMRDMESRLDPTRFVRVHRCALVAASRIRELQPYSRGEHLVVLTDGTKLPLSRRHRQRVELTIRGS
jgi:two-component system LytT family response regulator